MSPIDRAVSLDRRRFLQLLAAAGGVTVLGACSGNDGGASSPASTSPASSVAPDPLAPAHTLVLVQMNGGNDGLNTVVPDDGRYRDARPTLAIPEADVLRLEGLSGFALHPSLAPLQRLWADDRLAIVESIGFPQPDRSHFVAMDSWWTADDPSVTTGWLGRAFDTVSGEFDPLYAVAFGAGAPVLRGGSRQAIEILRSGDFRFADAVEADRLRLLSSPRSDDPLTAAAQASFERAVDAVREFDQLTAERNDESEDPAPAREGGASLADGLRTAAQLIVKGGASRLLVVSAGGFDTHAGQLETQAELLGDLASGIDGFFASLEEAGRASGVLLVTTSEFGRRVAENASGGTDHGKGGVSFVVGAGAAPGLHGMLDLKNLQDGDVRSSIDPRTLFTACLDWIGADAEAILGRRYDEVELLR